MQRMHHGAMASLEVVQATISEVMALNGRLASPVMLAEPRRLTEFGYMFPRLQDESMPEYRLPEGAETIANLILLGESMRDTSPRDKDDSMIPSAYTFLGQFIDHDITLELISDIFRSLDNPIVPSADQVEQLIKNERTATLDLDSVYEAPAPFDGEGMKLGMVSPEGHPVPGKDRENDLPRARRDSNPLIDRVALIGDARNDENLIIAQLHLALLRAHNAIVRRGHTWESARRILRQLYQWIVVNDFLVRVVGRDIVDEVKARNEFFTPTDDDFFMPLEFTVAAYRFGHSLVRAEFNYNVNFGDDGLQDLGTLERLFTFTALSGQLGAGNGFDTLPENCVIQWENFVDPNNKPARKIDTRLVEPLFHLREETGGELPGIMGRLAVRNLLRGYKLRMPTGQAVANEMNQPVLAASDLLDLMLANADRVGMTDADKDTLRNSGFDTRTPLWFYILAEAELMEGGTRLGPVGGRIVAEVLIGVARRSADSIFAQGDGWTPAQLGGALEEPIAPAFDLSDLLKLAGVLS